MENESPIRLGWMAGVIDLKGRLVHKGAPSRRTRQVTLVVDTIQFEVTRELSRLTGTKPELMQKRPINEFVRRGCNEHCPEAHVHVNDYHDLNLQMPAHARWTISGAGMVVVLQALLPLMLVDRGYAEVMDEVNSKVALNGQGSGAVLNSLRRLRSLGWILPDDYQAALDERDSRPATRDEIAKLIEEQAREALALEEE